MSDHPYTTGDLGRGPQLDPVSYRSAQPWPYLVIDGAFDPELVATAEAEQLEVAPGLRQHVSRRQRKAESSKVTGRASRELMDYLDGDEWVGRLRALTGIEDLEPDPSHFWAGLHVGPVDAFQAVHRDFQKHPATGLYHRVNVLLYLSSGWEEEEGGGLELWSSDAARCVTRVLPAAGRLVVFESHRLTLHGVGRQTSSRPGRVRLSLAAYYFSSKPPACGLHRTGTLFQPRIPGGSVLGSVIDISDAARGGAHRLSVLPSRLARLVAHQR
ncbi:MAG: 2OG-Fe(II) oxygenase [Acidobacteriota bacterium]|nr:2OG-Fe(II) oxygenase [Acidobacteriota bacterium]